MPLVAVHVMQLHSLRLAIDDELEQNDVIEMCEEGTLGTTTVDSIPDDAMKVPNEHGDNYVRFKSTNVLEWYTEKPDGTITRERFISGENVS